MSTDTKKFLEKMVGPLTFGMILRAYMDREEVTQSGLAEMLGVNKTYISNIVNGRKKVSIEKAIEIATILGEPPKTIIQAAINDALRGSGTKLEAVLREAA